MNALFLDIDGVMNTTSSVMRHQCGEVFAVESVIALRWLMTRIPAPIVITSTRRRAGLDAMRALFRRNQLRVVADRIIGHTPILTDGDTDDWREDEIELWLEANLPHDARIVILDDKPLRGPLARHQVLINADDGLTLERAALALRKWAE